MMNQPTSTTTNSISGTTDPWPTAAGTSLDGPQGASAAGTTGGNGHDALHRWAGKAHQAIDRMEQKLDSVGGSGGVGGLKSRLSRDGAYAERARGYGEQMRERVRSQPLQAAGIVFALGLVYGLMSRKRKVRVVEVPVYVPQSRRASFGERTHRLMDSSGDAMHRLGDSGHAAAKKLGATAMLGAASAKAITSRLLHDTRKAMPTAKQVRHTSQAYGNMARSQMQEHPAIGVALALGVGALVVSLFRQRRDDRIIW